MSNNESVIVTGAANKDIFRLYLRDNLGEFLSLIGAGSDQIKCLEIKRLESVLHKKVWSVSDKDDLVRSLSSLLLSKSFIWNVISCFSCLLPELYFRAVESTMSNLTSANRSVDALVSLLKMSIIIAKRGPLIEEEILKIIIWMKMHVQEFLKEDSVILNYLLLLSSFWDVGGYKFEQLCSLEVMYHFIHHDNLDIRWNACKILAKALKVLDVDSYISSYFSEEDYHQLLLKDACRSSTILPNTLSTKTVDKVSTEHSNAYIDRSDLRGNYIPIMNFLFPFHGENKHIFASQKESCIVLTKSTVENLKSLVLAVLSGSPVLLSGEIGCGKTMLIEYLASCIGRTSPPGLLKLQLGDQTDSKSLLGTYMCSDQPGTFEWQPGTLTQAVQHGSWVLLEDIDTAPPDVMSTLITLMKSKSLSITGRGGEIKPAAGFQIFATTRSGHKSFSYNENAPMYMLEKLCHRIHMDAPTKLELIEVVQTRLPNLTLLASKMVDVYSLVSSDITLESENDVLHSKLSTGSRQSTPRDLLKWCSRTSESIKQSNQIPAQECIFLKALHCFCLSVQKLNDRHAIAYSVGAKLGLTKEKVEYYLFKYKPAVKKTNLLFQVGNVKLNVESCKRIRFNASKQKFSFTRQSLKLLEDIAEGVACNEPILLVGETGCGKTSTVQFLAQECGQTVNVVNMSQQSDIADLLGGFKPLDTRQIVKPLKENFEDLFVETYSQKQNTKFLGHVNQCFSQKKWTTLIKLIVHCCQKALDRKKKETESDLAFEELKVNWNTMLANVKKLEKKIATQQGLVFNFVEGALVKCIKAGNWILLDEINLATADTLEYLSGLLDSQSGSMVLTERGDIEPIKRHENFRLFACMNPATDVGKKDLPYGIRNRFSEIYVDEMTDVSDLTTLVAYYLTNMNLSSDVINGIVSFYQMIRILAKGKLVDGSGHRPHYSLRTLCRGLNYAVNQRNYSPLRAVYEGLCMSFLTQLDRSSHPKVVAQIRKHVFAKVRNISSILSQPLPKPLHGNNVIVEGYWIRVGSNKPVDDEGYVLTDSVRKNLRDLTRVVAGGKHPVLLQGETSVGKTSLITYLANLTGNHCVRINNHEHTDIQEYIGFYGADNNGNLTFKEGVLVTAMQKGHWIILDELNLAPTDVLEALNRLLDDNRELFIAETQETVKAHSRFMLFATQNPPGHYGGRKILSRAFRNRFVELHFDEIPSKELEEILHKRCDLPKSYCRKFVKVMLDLQIRRRNSGIFAGKYSFMTLRDLFRWAERYRLSEAVDSLYDWEQCICEDGFLLIAGRCRKEEERQLIQHVLQQNFKKQLNIEELFSGNALCSKNLSEKIMSCTLDDFKHVVWTRSMKRLALLTGRALQFGESVLLVGETGCGKTTICQLFSSIFKQKLYSVNCHMHTESADFLGGLRPVRSKETGDQSLFEWCDGPLVNAMQQGQMFLIDEISLADDSVLERLNSVLETERMLVLSEKGEVDNNLGSVDIIRAKESFRLIATMNPGGDFGKKELSPALRNRFTEIWCSPSDGYDDLKNIIEHNIKPGLYLLLYMKEHDCAASGFGDAMIEFIKWFKSTEIGNRFVISIRDLLSWVQFINSICGIKEQEMITDDASTCDSIMSPEEAYVHGACLVFIDAIGSGNSAQLTGASAAKVKLECGTYLQKQVGLETTAFIPSTFFIDSNIFRVSSFYISKGDLETSKDFNYNFSSKTTLKNALHLLRGLQLSRPILLEGSPGVGKTSLVMAVAHISGHPITRINLSEETDVSDLFGSDLPVEGAEGGTFAWRDGPLLKALKAGHWVVFDELNLASQSVLEGLNACFDHRAEIYVPELSKTFQVQRDKTKIFACQNPLQEGGGRKGLPKSFLNRFTKVYVDAMTSEDLFLIVQHAFPDIPETNIKSMIELNASLHYNVVVKGTFGKKGGPWEFNIRDVMRWCELLRLSNDTVPGDFVGLIYQDRMRSIEDKDMIMKYYANEFGDNDLNERRKTQQCLLKLTASKLTIGHASIKRYCNMHNANPECLQLLRSSLPYLESIMMCVKMNWLSILVGAEATGKNTLVHILAHLTGQTLDVLSMNSGMDTSDFVGGFEQLNLSFHLKEIYNEAHILVIKLLQNVQESKTSCSQLFRVKQMLLEWITAGIIDEDEHNFNQLCTHFQQLIDEYGQKFPIIVEFQKHLCEFQVKLSSSKKSKGQFEWVDGILINALKKGHWMLIENVNFCSSSILDRLNALLEPNGVLTVDERGVVNGDIPKIVPHPNFRLFMSMDPKYGEISRAMRNRGVEIYIPSEKDDVNLDTIDANLLMKSKGLADESAMWFILAVHAEVKKQRNTTRPSKMLQAATLVSKLLLNGCDNVMAAKQACYEIYCRSDQNPDIQKIIKEFIVDTSLKLRRDVNLQQLVPDIKDYTGSLNISFCQRDCIPLQIIELTDISSFMTALLMFAERSSAANVSYRLSYLMECITFSGCINNILKLKHWFENVELKTVNAEQSICESINTANDFHSSAAKKYYMMLIQSLNGLDEITKDISCSGDSILSVSKLFTEGKVSGITLQHKSVMFLYNLCKLITDYIRESWIHSLTLDTPETFGRIENSLFWFYLFVQFCKMETPRTSFSTSLFSLNVLALHWKWLKERFLVNFDLPTSDDFKFIIEQLDVVLGHDKAIKIMFDVVNVMGKPKGFSHAVQFQLMTSLFEMYDQLRDTPVNDQSVALRKDIMVHARDLWNSSTLNEHVVNQVNTLSLKVQDHATPVLKPISKNQRKLCEALFVLSYYDALVQMSFGSDQNSNRNLEHLAKYGFIFNIAHANQLLCLDCLGGCRNEADQASFHTIIPHVQLNVHSILFNDLSSFFTGHVESSLNVQQVILPPCIPILSMLQAVMKQDKKKLLLGVSLNDFEETKEVLKNVQTWLWSNMNQMLIYKKTSKSQLNLLSWYDIVNILNALDTLITEDSHKQPTIKEIDWNKKQDEVVGKICEKMKTIHASNMLLINTKNILAAILEFHHEYRNNVNPESEYVNTVTVANLVCLSGLLLFDVSRPWLKYDPVEEVTIRLQSLKKQLQNINTELKVRYEAEYIWSGSKSPNFETMDVQLDHFTSNPERVHILLARRSAIISEIQVIKTEETARPVPSQYNALYQDFQHFIETIGNVSHVLELVKEMKMLILSSSPCGTERLLQVFQKVKLWISSTHQFAKKVFDSYPMYKDLTIVACNGLKKCQNGFLLMLQCADQRLKQAQFYKLTRTKEVSYSSDLFNHLCNSHINRPLENTEFLFQNDMKNLAGYLCNDKSELSDVQSSILNLALLNLQKYFCCDQLMFKQEKVYVFSLLKKILDHAYHLWCDAKQQQIEEEERKSSLYKYRTQTHCEIKTDEEESDESQRKLFPSFEHVFSDLLITDTFNDSEPATVKANEESGQSSHMGINEEFIYDIVKSIYFKGNSDTSSCSLLENSFQEAIKLLIVPEVIICLDYEKLPPTLLIMVSKVLEDVSNEGVIDPAFFNIYSDYCVKEALETKHILIEFSQYLKQLLSQFEDHPALLQILEIIKRILSFSIYSPLMKFVTGFELLLKQAQNWEMYAGSHVSLRKNLQDISSKVIEWRKLELKSWPLLLERSERKIAQSVSKWLFQFYNLFEEMEKKKEAGVDIQQDAFMTAVKEFLEQSTIGDFHARIEMMRLLMIHLQTHGICKDLESSIWNVYMYYQQFMKPISHYIQVSKKPIEKELKDFVKIAKWNDINFYAMKQAVDKSHRTLNKFVRRYEAILRDSIQQFLQDSRKHITAPPTIDVKQFHFIVDNTHCLILKKNVVSLDDFDELYLNKVVKLQMKMRMHVKNICLKMKYGTLVEHLDGFTGDIIDGIKELQAENVLNLPKEKQKSARTNTQQRKRKALASLFKELRSIGISYRKGQHLSEVQDEQISLPIIDLNHCFRREESLNFVDMLKSCNSYFFGCAAKQAIFHAAALVPSKELGPGEVTRFKGLSAHLFYICCEQRKELHKVLTAHSNFSRIVFHLKDVKDTSNNDVILPVQEHTKNFLIQMRTYITESLLRLDYFAELLRACPKEPSQQITSPFPIDVLPPSACYHLGDDKLNCVLQLVKNITNVISELKKELDQFQIDEFEFPLLKWSHWNFFTHALTKLHSEMENIDQITTPFLSPENPESASLADVLVDLKTNTFALMETFDFVNQTNQKYASVISPDIMVQYVESFIQRLLLSVQSIVKISDEYETTIDELEQDKDSPMLIGHLSPLLTKCFQTHNKLLDLDSILNSCNSYINHLSLVYKNSSVNSPIYKASLDVSSLLEEYCELLHFYTFHAVTLHRTCCKLLFVLYGLFTDLLKEGYCIPPEEDGSVCGEGATEFEDIQNGGLGEGEGAKDVSEQIESEDQLEDTHHEKSEDKKDDDDDDIEDEKEGVEMSDDFEGKLQDLEMDDEKSSDEEDNEDAEEEAEKQMGDVDDEQETVDEKMWGDSDNEDEDDEDQKKTEKGTGAEGQSESQLVANEENAGEQEGDDKDKRNEEANEHDIQEEESNETNEQDGVDDQQQGDDDQTNDVDDVHKDEEDVDIPDDLNLDADEETEGVEKEEDVKENDDEDNDMEAGEEDEVEPEDQRSTENLDDIEDDSDDVDDKNVNDTDHEMHPNNSTSLENVEETPPDVDIKSSTTESSQQESNSNDQGVGAADTDGQDGHHGPRDAISKQQSEKQRGRKRKDLQHTNEERSLEKEKIQGAKKRKALDAENDDDDDEEENNTPEEADAFQHVKDDSLKFDQLTIDTATKEQLNELQHPQSISNEESDVEMENEEDVLEEKDVKKEKESKNELSASKSHDIHGKIEDEICEEIHEHQKQSEEADQMETEVMREIKSDFFTSAAVMEIPLANIYEKEEAMEKLRSQLEKELVSLSVNKTKVEDEKAAMELWMKFEKLTSGLAQQLCEQLRLILEPTVASKMRGDYRTGKRLNMRKVIPYIASQFRKDKIWLRRTKKSKRKYQIVMAVDDSSSMTDNHSKQLAFESLAVISNALRWLEAGDLAVCSFGEEARLIHSFDEPFSEHAGASILQQFTFEQKKTKIGQLLNMCTVMLNDAQSHQRSTTAVSQLLLILSDGRGIFLEGKEVVLKAASQAREAGIFTVFLIIDDPKNQDSILDIKVPIFNTAGGMPEIKSYIEEFPFPFYVLLRDINSLPNVLSDALKQWFELITQTT